MMGAETKTEFDVGDQIVAFKRKMKPGRHSFMVRATNAAGESDPTPAKFTWRVS